ncbi:hypothetical protein M413DRAFT_162350 [Hebeloma cylindrosporum]|uniref:Uncharacterized protein n=1 Tax=Hebeloma cylindrosporum TaxID=76867 RepID=A0A0C3BUY3_HEBCY|nr:hypothetical protein M413DRAFT_162350 [Hebeloma cylindrosporum h7]
MATDKNALLESITHLELRKHNLLRELEDVNLELGVQRAQYSRLLNNDSFVYRLPNELLTGILINLQRSVRYPLKPGMIPFQVTASHVSRRWRDVVLSTPLLWNTIDFRIRPMNHVQGRILSQLDAYLTRSDTCFLDITLDFHIVDDLSSYFDLLAAHSRRWRRLAIVTRYEQVDDIQNLLKNIPTIGFEHLSLSLGKPQEGSLSPRKPYATISPTILLAGCPSLTFVRLAGLALGNLHPPLTTVTTLHLDGWTRNFMTHDQLKAILEASVSLVNLSLNQLHIHHPRDPLEVIHPVSLPNLQCLRLLGPCSPVSRLLSLMDTPKLLSLSLQDIDTFDSNILPSVQSLSMDRCALDDLEVAHLFRSFPSVEFLSIDESLPDIYYMLRPNLDQPHPWPRLRTISLRALPAIDVHQFCNLVFTLQQIDKSPLAKVYLDRRSRTSLRTKHRLDWLQDQLQVEHCDVTEPWPLGLGYEDAHDLLE